MSESHWRLILSEPTSGAMNMALDEAILEAVTGLRMPPTLRFYAWNPPCLSIGYAQSVADVNPAAIKREGWDLVRRATGGRAILHTDEITYSITAPADHPIFAHGVLPSYKRISLALISGLEKMGLLPELHTSHPRHPSNGNPVCFQNPSAFEIMVNGKKLVGSAQLRRAGGILQHGSLPLQGELGRICLALLYASDHLRQQAMREIGQHAISVEGALGNRISWADTARHLAAGFEEALNLRFSRQQPSEPEIVRAHEILKNRYSHPDWTQRV
ncbi:MAG: lipoate--protein ligase family protein [Chloroflexi bacterium]|nr:lipoate--protein ligase family protein [Chloroflexota bacterium]